MRNHILEQWLNYHGFLHAEGVARLIQADAKKGDVGAHLFVVQASHWFAERDGGVDLVCDIEQDAVRAVS